MNVVPVLLEVGYCRSISKAARNLFLSQPQVSYMIRAAEEEAGFPIFTRSSTGVSPTAEGRLYLESLRIIDLEMKKIRQIPGQLNEKQDLSVASIYSRFFFELFLRFTDQDPSGSTPDYFGETMHRNVIEEVVSQKARLGLIIQGTDFTGPAAQGVERYGLELLPLHIHVPILIIVGRRHPLAQRQFLTVEDLREYPMVFFLDEDMSLMESIYSAGKINNRLLVRDRASQLQALDTGRYLSFSSTGSDHVTEADKYVYLPIRDKHYFVEACCVKLRSYSLTSREQRFLRFFKTVGRQLAGPTSKK